ncbi:unnamed protein product [Adineta ricciae]|uniref:Doublecortin domain-containing protein n=1 Tax=Adineta ricciae TaxID=249248 RepID=A0A813Z0S3_ADIRI|nr:unnamed protein product [Adineta ricciae]
MLTEYDSQQAHHDHRHHQQHDQRDFDHQDQRDQQQQQPPRLTGLERGRAIRLMRNGDLYFPGRSFVINQRKYPMLDVFLDDASQALNANFGAVRCIYTPKNGTRLHDISELEDHQTYVAAGAEKFKRLQYYDIAEGKRPAIKDRTPPRLPPVRRFDIEGRALKLSRSENVIIYVYRNGDPLTLPAKILLVKPTLQNWESVLDEITRKVSLTSTAVLKLYTMNGELVTSAQQLEYGGMYVAAGKERFKRIDYPDPKSFSPNSSPKMSRKSDYPRIKLPVRQKRVEDYDYHPSSSNTHHTMQQRYTKSDGTNTHTATTANSHGSNEYGGHRRPVREENDFFNNKPHSIRRGPTQETDLDRDDGGIYKGRLNHRERVREIDDTRDTKVDLPVDYREIETVEDENYYGNTEKNARRQHQSKSNQPVANSRRRSPPVRSVKTPPKNYPREDKDHDEEDRKINKNKSEMNNGHQQRSNNHRMNGNGYENGNHRRTPPQIDDDDDDEDNNRDEQQMTRFHHQQEQFAPSKKQVNQEDKDHAATVIQSHVRGYFTRKQTHHEKPNESEQRHNGYNDHDNI